LYHISGQIIATTVVYIHSHKADKFAEGKKLDQLIN